MSVTIQTGNSVAIQTGNRVIITAPGPQGPPGGGGGSGDVVGPSSSTDNAIARFNLATGKLIQNSGITIADGASGTLSGTNTGDQTIALTGDVTGSGTGTFAATIANDAVTFAKMQNISGGHLIGRHSSGSGDPQQVGVGSSLAISGSNLERAALTGDVTASEGSNTTTLANTAVTPGAYTRANVTVDSKGRITAAENGAVIDLATEVTGTLDDAYIASADTWNAKLDANGDGSALTGITAAQVGAVADGDTLSTGLIFPITNGVRLLDSSGDHKLSINAGEELTADRGLNFVVNDGSRTVNLSGNLTVSAAATVSGTNTGDQTVGTTAGTVAAGDDSRFTDARTPTAHASSHVTGGTDKIRDATASQDGLATATQIAKLDGIEAGANNYTLPAPTTTVIGGVKRNTGSAGQFVNGIDTDGSLQYGTPAGSGSGTVTSVAISGTDGIEVDSGSPITTDGTIQLGVNAATMKTTLDLTGTNSGDVTLAGTPDYITISGQTITRNAIDLAADVTGTLPASNGGTGITALGTGVATALGQNVTGSGSIVLGTSPTLITPALGTPSALTLTNATGLPLTTGVTGILPIANIATGTPDGTKFVRDDGTLATPAGSGTVTSVGGTGTVNGITLSGTVTSAGNLTLGGALSGVDLTTAVTGALPIANGGTGQTTQTAAFDALAPTTTKGDIIVHNGTDNIRVPVGATNGHVLTVDSAEASGVKWAAGGGGGGSPAAIQVVKTDSFSTTSTNGTWADVTGVTVNITPSATSKRVLVNVFLTVSASTTAGVAFRVLRDATPLPVGTVAGSRTAVTGVVQVPSGGDYFSQSVSCEIIDAPASTSAITYKVQITGLSGGGITSYINRTGRDDNAGYTANGISYIRVQEVD